MTRKKPRFIVDADTQVIFSDPRISKLHFKSLQDVQLPLNALDQNILSAGQREERVVLTRDKGSSFSRRIVLSPTFNRTGVVVILTSPKDSSKAVMNLYKVAFHDDLVHARTELSLSEAKISKSDKNIVVKFQ